MDIVCRPAKLEDLGAAVEIVRDTYNDLRLRHGLQANVVLGQPAFQRFCQMEDPDGLWVAERGDELLGFGFAWMRASFWYLAQLFVLPEVQATGIGQALFSKATELAERRDAENRALITMAYNTASLALYIRNGLYPREPLLRLAAPAHVIKRTSLAGLRYGEAPIEPWPRGREWLGQLDLKVLGFQREEHHGFLGGSAARALRFEEAGSPVGYAYVSREGHVGPLAVTPGADSGQVIRAAIRSALEVRPERVTMIVPGRADLMLRAAWDLGFRLEEPLVLLSAKPFGDWRYYLPNNPAFM